MNPVRREKPMSRIPVFVSSKKENLDQNFNSCSTKCKQLESRKNNIQVPINGGIKVNNVKNISIASKHSVTSKCATTSLPTGNKDIKVNCKTSYPSKTNYTKQSDNHVKKFNKDVNRTVFPKKQNAYSKATVKEVKSHNFIKPLVLPPHKSASNNVKYFKTAEQKPTKDVNKSNISRANCMMKSKAFLSKNIKNEEESLLLRISEDIPDFNSLPVQNKVENDKHYLQPDVEFEANDIFRKMILSEKALTPHVLNQCSGKKLSVSNCPSLFQKYLCETKNPHQAALKAIENVEFLQANRRISEMKRKGELFASTPNHHSACITPYERAMQSIDALRFKQKIKSAKKVHFDLTDSSINCKKNEVPSTENRLRLTDVSEKSEGSSNHATPEFDGMVTMSFHVNEPSTFTPPNEPLVSRSNDKHTVSDLIKSIEENTEDSTPELDLNAIDHQINLSELCKSKQLDLQKLCSNFSKSLLDKDCSIQVYESQSLSVYGSCTPKLTFEKESVALDAVRLKLNFTNDDIK